MNEYRKGVAVVIYSINTLCRIQSCIGVGRSGRLVSINGCSTKYGKGIIVFNDSFNITKYSTITIRTKR